MAVDIILSSGFLAFSRHVGFLSAVEQRVPHVGALCGTSSGALTAALWASGRSAADIGQILSAWRPVSLAQPSWQPWRGLCSLDAFVAWLGTLLPAHFADLRHPLALGVMDAHGKHHLLTDGPLPLCVAASCAIPRLFTPIVVNGVRYVDGGAADRLGLSAFRQWRGIEPIIAHWVERTAGKDVDANMAGVTVVRTPRAHAQFWNLGDFGAEQAEAERLSHAALEAAGFSLSAASTVERGVAS